MRIHTIVFFSVLGDFTFFFSVLSSVQLWFFTLFTNSHSAGEFIFYPFLSCLWLWEFKDISFGFSCTRHFECLHFFSVLETLIFEPKTFVVLETLRFSEKFPLENFKLEWEIPRTGGFSVWTRKLLFYEDFCVSAKNIPYIVDFEFFSYSMRP